MKLSRNLMNAIGTGVVALVVLAGTILVVALSTETHTATAHVGEVAFVNQRTRMEIAERADQEVALPSLRHDLDDLRMQITEADELSDASALASAAAKRSGARIVAITFAGRQVFAAPTGTGMGDDGMPTTPPGEPEPNTPHVQLPVTFEVEVSSTAQAAAFIHRLQDGPRLLQVVQAQSSPTNNAKLFTVTVDALIFAARW